MAPPAAIMRPLADITNPANGRSPGDYAVFMLALAASGAVYLLVAWVLRIPELYRFVNIVRRRFGWPETTIPRR
jgi:hypothetical protein